MAFLHGVILLLVLLLGIYHGPYQPVPARTDDAKASCLLTSRKRERKTFEKKKFKTAKNKGFRSERDRREKRRGCGDIAAPSSMTSRTLTALRTFEANEIFDGEDVQCKETV